MSSQRGHTTKPAEKMCAHDESVVPAIQKDDILALERAVRART